jgi:hypothetical protein
LYLALKYKSVQTLQNRLGKAGVFPQGSLRPPQSPALGPVDAELTENAAVSEAAKVTQEVVEVVDVVNGDVTVTEAVVVRNEVLVKVALGVDVEVKLKLVVVPRAKRAVLALGVGRSGAVVTRREGLRTPVLT